MTSPRTILGLAVAWAVLAMLYVWQRHATPSHRPETKASEKLPAKWDASEVRYVDILRHEEGVRLAKTADGWVVLSRGAVRADAAAVESLLSKLGALEGERREGGGGQLEPLELTDEKAIQIVLRDQNGGPLLRLLCGIEREGARGTFVKLAGEGTVWAVDADVRSEAGVDSDGHPEVKKWLDLSVVSLDKKQIERLTLKGPELQLVIEGREIREGEAAKIEWVLSSPQVPFPLREGQPERMVSAFVQLRAEDVPDPAAIDAKKTGLDAPVYAATAKLRGGGEHVVRVGGTVPEIEGRRFARATGRDQVYAVSRWTIEDLFQPFNRVADLPGPDIAKERIVRVELRDARREIVLVRGVTGTWALASPEAAVAVRSQDVEGLIEAAAGTRPADLVMGVQDGAAGLAPPEWEIVLTDSDGKSTWIRAGRPRASDPKERYARFSTHERMVTLSTSAMAVLFPDARELMDLAPLHVRGPQVAAATARTAQGTVRLTRGEPWTATFGGAAFDAQDKGIERILQAIEEFRADDLVTRQVPWEEPARIEYEIQDGRRIAVEWAKIGEEAAAARIDGESLTYKVSPLERMRATFTLWDLIQPAWPRPSEKAGIVAASIHGAGAEAPIPEIPSFELELAGSAAGQPTGLGESGIAVRFRWDERTAELILGGPVEGGAGRRFVRIGGTEGVWTISEEQAQKLLGLLK